MCVCVFMCMHIHAGTYVSVHVETDVQHLPPSLSALFLETGSLTEPGLAAGQRGPGATLSQPLSPSLWSQAAAFDMALGMPTWVLTLAQ